MTKRRRTRRALINSVISLLICFSMLLGTTFAWFTDSVTSAKNQIIAGNLDIEVYWATPNEVVNGDIPEECWKKLNPEDPVFNEDALWEPGYTEAVFFKFVNEGTLALQYQFNVDILEEIIGKTKTETDIQLSEHIQAYACNSFAWNYNDYLFTDRDQATNPVGAPNPFHTTLFAAANGEIATPSGDNPLSLDSWQWLEPTETTYATLVLWMPEEVGNEANHNGKDIPSIELGISVVATQYTYEEDSFDNQYDKDATYPEEPADVWDGTADTTWYNDTDTSFTLSTAEELAGLAELTNGGNKFSKKTIVLDSNMDMNRRKWTPIKNFAGTLDGNDHTIGNFEIDAEAGNAGFIDVMEWATVKDLTFNDVIATVGDYRFGVLARSINQSNIDNVTVKNVAVTTTGSEAFVAGLFAQGTVNSNMEVNNCTVENMTVNAENGAMIIAGITDFVQKNGTEAEGTNILENLHVKNFKVIAKDTDGYCNIGGLVGQTQSVWQNPRFNNCSVSGLDVTATGTANVGGFMCAPGSYTYTENCTVEGKIDVSAVTSGDYYAGGFYGNYGWGDNVGKGDHKATSCSTDVDITTKHASAGGFVGSGTNTEGRNKNITLTNCEAKGTVTCVEGGTANIGGFAGKTDRGIYINCVAAQDPFIGKVLDGYTLVDDGSGSLTVTKDN